MSMERFGDLLLMERLAAGGMAEVFRGKQLGYAGFEKTVAIKRILPHFASSDDFKQMFRAEANLSAMLQHPNISQVFANGEHEGYLYLVMEYVDGKNLRQLLARADKVKFRIPLEISCFIVSEGLKGLDYAHNFLDERTGEALNIVHRDVSPQNLMMAYEGSVKLVDFGIAKAASKAENTRAGVLKGKFGYMSPEQARGASLDKRSDVFSMGIILWELITQRRLFTYEDEMKTLEKVRECKVPRPSEKNPTIPYALEKIVLRSLEKEPTNRYSSAAEFYGDLARYMNDRHPNFIPTDFSRFMKEFYKEEIADEKRRREKLNLEAPAFLSNNPITKRSSPASNYGGGSQQQNDNQQGGKKNDRTGSRTQGPLDEDTLVSDIREQANLGASSTPPDLRSTLNQDPSSNTVQSVSRIPIAESASHKIKFHSPTIPVAPQPDTQVRVKPSRNAFLRIAGIILVCAGGTYAVLTYGPKAGSDMMAQVNGYLKPNNGADQTESGHPTGQHQVPIANNATAPNANPSHPDMGVPNSGNAASAAREPATVVTPSGGVFVWEPRKYDIYGSININGVPNADIILINGQKLVDTNNNAIKTPLHDLRLEPGTYQLDLKNTVFGVSKSVTVKVEKNKSSRIEAILDKR